MTLSVTLRQLRDNGVLFHGCRFCDACAVLFGKGGETAALGKTTALNRVLAINHCAGRYMGVN